MWWERKMKKLILVLTLLFVSTTSAEEVVQEISKRSDWKARIIRDHQVTAKEACVASTKTKDKMAKLEVYAEKSESGSFVEPTVQIILKEPTTALGAMVDTGSGESLPMTIALQETEGPVAFLIKHSDRAQLIDDIKSKSRVKVSFFGPQGEVKKIKFSLRGSSKTVKKLFESCELEVTE